VSGATQTLALRRLGAAGGLKLASGGAVLALVGAGLALAAYRYPPPSLALTLAGGLAFASIVALAISRYEVAVGLGFCLLGIQAAEPAPPDAVFAIVIAVAAVTGRFDATRVPLTIFGTLGALLVLNLISTIGAIDPARAAFFFAITLYLAVFSVWLTGYMTSEGRARLFVRCYLFAAITSAVVGILAVLAPLPARESLLYFGRAKALFVDANVFGPFMIPALLILIEEVLRPRLLRLRNPIKLGFIFILTAAVLFSYSRAAWLNAVLAIVVLFGVLSVRRGGARHLAALVLILIALGIGGSVLVSASGSESLLEERASVQTYDVQRFTAQRTGLRLAEEHPLGIGPGQFEPVAVISAHNTYIRVFAEQGILGLVAFAGLALSTLVLAMRNAALGQHTYGIGSAALLAAWFGLLVNSFFVDTLHWRVFWLVAALIWAGSLRAAVRARRAY
jgi:O-antigen ligase